MQLGNRHDAARWPRLTHDLGVDRVEVRPILHPHEVDRDLDQVAGRGAGRDQDGDEIGQRLAHLVLERLPGGVAAVRPHAQLARDIDQPAVRDGGAVVAGGRLGFGHDDRAQGFRHHQPRIRGQRAATSGEAPRTTL
jgi:hypothetical protein